MIKKENYWPIGLTVVILAFLLFFVGFFIFAHMNRIDLVEKDYYKKELEYQEHIERIERSKELSESVVLNYDEPNQKMELRFPVEIDPLNVSGKIMFFRPSDARQDKLIPLELSLDRTQLLEMANMPAGRWKVKVFWTADNTDYYDEFEIFIK